MSYIDVNTILANLDIKISIDIALNASAVGKRDTARQPSSPKETSSSVTGRERRGEGEAKFASVPSARAAMRQGCGRGLEPEICNDVNKDLMRVHCRRP